MIPEIMNFFWHTGPMTWLRYCTLASFVALNPDWKTVLHIFDTNNLSAPWECHNKQDFEYNQFVDYFDRVQDLGVEIVDWSIKDYMPKNMCPSQASNFFKFSYLGEHGGMYADMDIIFFKPIKELYEELRFYDVGLSYTKYFSVGLMSSSIGDDSLLRISKDMSKDFAPTNYQGAWIVTMLKIKNIDAYMKKYGNTVYNIDMDYLYFLDSRHISHIWQMDGFEKYPRKAIGVHWYAGNPLSQEWNMKLSPENYRSYENTITSAIKLWKSGDRVHCEV